MSQLLPFSFVLLVLQAELKVKCCSDCDFFHLFWSQSEPPIILRHLAMSTINVLVLFAAPPNEFIKTSLRWQMEYFRAPYWWPDISVAASVLFIGIYFSINPAQSSSKQHCSRCTWYKLLRLRLLYCRKSTSAKFVCVFLYRVVRMWEGVKFNVRQTSRNQNSHIISKGNVSEVLLLIMSDRRHFQRINYVRTGDVAEDPLQIV